MGSKNDAFQDVPPASTLRVVKNSYEWQRTWRYVIVQPSVKNVGFAVATFANKDGTRIFPGVRRLMTISGYSNKAVVDALAALRWLGFIYRVSCGVRNPTGGVADTYQLCLPRDMSRVPMADAKAGTDPVFEDLPCEAQRAAVILGVAARLRKTSSELSSERSELSSLDPVTSVHNTKASTKSKHHSASSDAASRASSRGDDPSEAYDFIDDAVGGLDPVESSTAEGMLGNGKDPRYIINTILKRRDAAA